MRALAAELHCVDWLDPNLGCIARIPEPTALLAATLVCLWRLLERP